MDISIEHAVATYFSQWLTTHPYLAWTISHPLPSLGLLLLILFSLWGLIKAIGRGIEQIWLFLLKTPFKLLQAIFRPIWSSIRQMFGHNNNVSGEQLGAESISTSAPTQIERIVDRLQVLSQEQDSLLRELSILLTSTSVESELKTISDTQYRDLYAKLPKLN
jgi:hypothetical protein